MEIPNGESRIFIMLYSQFIYITKMKKTWNQIEVLCNLCIINEIVKIC